jgi:hypothetical protein
MNNYQIVKLDSDELVVKEAESSPEITGSIPAFATGIAKLKANNAAIRNLKINQESNSKGVTTNKRNAVTSLIDWTIEIAGAVHSYAIGKNDNNLIAQSDITINDVIHIKTLNLITKAQSVLNLVIAIPIADLSQYGITDTEITEFEKALELVDGLKSSTREVTIDRSDYTEQIGTIHADSQELLTNTLDRIALQFKRREPAFYARYKAARSASVAAARKKKDTTTVINTNDTTTPTK